MQGFETFDTTNKVYGKYYKREQDPITNIPVYKIPDNEEEKFYRKTLEMRENYFDRYAHLNKNIDYHSYGNKFDSKSFKKEDLEGLEKKEELQKPHVMSYEFPEKEIPNSFQNDY